MGITAGPRISTRGLIFAFDEANSRSWRGKPITNLIGPSYANLYHPSNKPASAAPHSNSYSLTTEIEPPVPGLDVYKAEDLILDTQTIRFSIRLDMDAAWFNYDTTYTWSFYIYIPKEFENRLTNTTCFIYQNSTGVDWHNSRGYNSTYNFYGAGEITNSFTTFDVTKTGEWQRVSATFTPLSANIQIAENNGLDNNKWVAGYHRTNISYGTINDSIQIPYHFYIAGGQVIEGSNDVPFTIDSRSATEAITDISAASASVNIDNLTYLSGNKFDFDGVDDALTVSGADYPLTWDDPFSIETLIRIPSGAAWQNTTSPTNNSGTGIIGRGGYQGSIGLLRYDTGTTRSFRFHMRSDGIFNTAIYNNPQFDTWYHLVGTYDSTELKLYVNGNLESTVGMTRGTDQPDPGAWKIAGDLAFGGTSGLFGKGKIPFARIYRVVLSDNEVRNNYEAAKPRMI